MLEFTQYTLEEPTASKPANFDMHFLMIMRPDHLVTSRLSSRLSRSNFLLIHDVNKSITVCFFIDFCHDVFFLQQYSPLEIGIIRQLPFSSSLQRTSVIVRVFARNTFDLLTKGSPEKIVELSRPDTSKYYILFIKLFVVYFLISSRELQSNSYVVYQTRLSCFGISL